MEVLLSSFGLSHEDVVDAEPKHRPNPFYRMPPVMMSVVRETFYPDYAVFLLCDRVVVDTTTYRRLTKDPPSLYQRVADTVGALHSEGFVRLEDFRSIVRENSALLREMLNRDLRHVEDWLDPLADSLGTWGLFLQKAKHVLVDALPMDRLMEMASGHMRGALEFQTLALGHVAAAPSSLGLRAVDDFGRARALQQLGMYATRGHSLRERDALPALGKADSNRREGKRRWPAEFCKGLSEYLAYVNANLVISNVLGVGIHDWSDFLPFYREKMLTVGRETAPEQQRVSKLDQLFEVSFPEYRLWSARKLVKALKDKRIAELRRMVDGAVKGSTEFDVEFARGVLADVFRIERKVHEYRRIASLAAAPLGLVPRVGPLLEKGAVEGIVQLKERKLKEGYQWFYLISECGGEPQRPEDVW